eukprot:Em0006g984a
MAALSQFAEQVVNYSSEYGNVQSAYSASNLAGPRRIHNYGDFTEAFVLRTYGPWWNLCPSARRKLKKASEAFISEDFVVVRILACNTSNQGVLNPGEVRWVTLWSGETQCRKVNKELRMFNPPIKKIDFATNLIRLEFNSVDCGYYTELDSVELCGNIQEGKQKQDDRHMGFQVEVTAKMMANMGLVERQTSYCSDQNDWGYFGFLTDEVIQLILQYLDIVSLASVAQTCKLLCKNAYDPLLYTELDLQSRWNTVDNVALEALVARCCNIQHLDLSWTGGGGQITESAFCSFIENCGRDLRTLRLSCCQYINDVALETIGRECTKLEELDLQSCSHLKKSALSHIAKLACLQRLNLYKSTNLTSDIIAHIGSNCKAIKHLNIGASCRLLDSKGIAVLNTALSRLKDLISLDLWRCTNCNAATIKVLADNCPNLQELDIGWCSQVLQTGFDILHLSSQCTNLRKLFFTRGTAVDSHYLEILANHCPTLEQLDILGANSATPDSVNEVAKKCRNLKFFDVSFCSQINEAFVTDLRKKYPSVTFKKSFS